MKKFNLLLILLGTSFYCLAFPAGINQKEDTIIIKVGDKSKVIIQVDNQQDLEELKKYDLNSMIFDLNLTVDSMDQRSETITIEDESGEKYLKESEQDNIEQNEEDEDRDYGVRFNSDYDQERDRGDNDRERDYFRSSRPRYRTHHSLNFDLGMNNYLENGNFPDENNQPYTVKPFGSWYVAINSTWHSRFSRNFSLDWGGNISWYNFKLQNENVRFVRDSVGVGFVEDLSVNAIKSKLTVVYLNVSMVPMLHLGSNSYYSRRRFRNHEGLRVGLGGYGGYRIDSYTKFVFKESGDKEKDKDHDNFFLNNWRYGLRFQFGFRGVDLFANYDLNNLFSEGRGPDLNAISFGIVI